MNPAAITPALLRRIDELINSSIAAARVPGAGLAIVAGGEVIQARGYGVRDLAGQQLATADTLYPIGSTTKAFTAAVIGTLVDEGRLSWDSPIHTYAPKVRLWDVWPSAHATLRDLLSMRVGLPRHDWVWLDNPMGLEDVIKRLGFLEPSCGFRERYQYNNLTYLAAAYVAQTVTGQTWSEMVGERILAPLGMNTTNFSVAEMDEVTSSYRENREREIAVAPRLGAESVAPAGGTLHSTVLDMARWMLFNLRAGTGGVPLRPGTLEEIQSPVIATRTDSAAPSLNAAYGMGWFIDVYRGHTRLSHGGYLHDVHSEVSLFPQDGIGLVSYTNLGAPRLSGFVNQRVFDLLLGLEPCETVNDRLGAHERKIRENHERLSKVRRVAGTCASHALEDYVGHYEHPAYGEMEVEVIAGVPTLHFRSFRLPLAHWHHDSWVAQESNLFGFHEAHPFDYGNPIDFETGTGGCVSGLRIRLEPAVTHIRFEKMR